MISDLTKAERLARAMQNVLSGGRSFNRQLAAQTRDELRRLDSGSAKAADRIAALEAQLAEAMEALGKLNNLTARDAAIVVSALAKLEGKADAENGWQSIETAPKDGTKFLAYEGRDDFCVYECWWLEDFPHWEGWQCHWDSEADPTHWMPLPAPPETERDDDG